jgi:Domain of unknown function (DUF4287)
VTERRGPDRSRARVDARPHAALYLPDDPGGKIRAVDSSYLWRAPANGGLGTVEHAPPWPKQGPASYFPSIEKKYGRSIAEWQRIIADSGLEKHMAIVGYLKSEYGMGHGHANALVAWTLKGNVARH